MHSPSDRARASMPPARLRCIAQITRAARKLSTAPPIAWLERYFAGVDEQDLQARSPNELARLATRHWLLGTRGRGARRADGQPLLEVWNPDITDGINDRRSYLLIVTDDQPFLIDSVMMTLARHRIAVHLIVHPVLAGMAQGAQSKPESWQLIEIDRQLDRDLTQQLKVDLLQVLQEVRLAVTDWPTMRDQLSSVTDQLHSRLLKSLSAEQQAEHHECIALLEWIVAGNFVLMGYQYFALARAEGKDELRARKPSALGIFHTKHFPQKIIAHAALRKAMRDPTPVIVTKTRQQSRIHRAGHLDHIAVKHFDATGAVVGEHRFIGLWTSRAYFLSPRDIPLLRRKIIGLIAEFGLEPTSHDGKAVLATLENWPRDELFASSRDELQRFIRAAVNLYDRGTTRSLLRYDALGDFWSALIFVPRDRYNTEVRVRIEELLRATLKADDVESQPQVAASGHARLHITVRGEIRELDDETQHALETQIAEATLTWLDRLSACMEARYSAIEAARLKRRHAARFSPAYQSEVDTETALADLQALDGLNEAQDASWRMVRQPTAQGIRVELRIVRHGPALPIADLMPLLENFGLRLLAERPWAVLASSEAPAGWIQAFELDPEIADCLTQEQDAERLLHAMRAVQDGFFDSDALNRLVLRAQLRADEVNLLRAICRYLLQTGLPFSLSYMAETLARHATLAKDIYSLFALRHDPALSSATREHDETQLRTRIDAALERLASADEDRILRALLAVVMACLRSNYHARRHQNETTLAFKLNPTNVPGLPLPKPDIETWVFGSLVEGVHLRMGQVARGGLRWSDRREDFRTEILGLMKAQNVKNTVIVPVGAKGGFVVRKSAVGLTRDAWLAHGIQAYRAYIGALLDITDNVQRGKIIPPAGVHRWDDDDPYLVVAADKGTATFSDIANEIALQRRFWLGDAFASGGSVGYDHKKMGITARGAWECVQRHFRELNLDTQRDEFTVVGIGDMSGDVFGNGMLLSDKIKLVAAFNHQHIFIDPNPNTATSFLERQRLFKLPRSGWNDYDHRHLSAGGGIYARDAKTITLSSQARALLQLPVTPIAPNELIQAILRLPVDLLWNGGIGTYVKASQESHAEASDRSNDAVRVDGRELRARVVGEGGNLGLTQLARVEYARQGGRINTDFIDNSAGVNTSDLEVNIKILLAAAETAGSLKRTARNQLLARLEPEVATLALRNNYLQSQALSILQTQAASRANEFRVLIRSLERQAGLNRRVEKLPDDVELTERQKRHEGLTRPELAVVFSYAKMDLNRRLLASPLPEDPYFVQELARYFPPALQKKFSKEISRHRLRREIIVTATTNSIINRMGPSFASRAAEESASAVVDVARAYSIAREAFDAREAWADLEKLDGQLSSDVQYRLYGNIARGLRHATMWMLQHHGRALASGQLRVIDAVARYAPGIKQLRKSLPQLLSGLLAERFETEKDSLLAAGLSATQAYSLATFPVLEWTLDVIDLAAMRRIPLDHAARRWFALPVEFKFDWIEELIDGMTVESSLHAAARRQLRGEVKRSRRDLVDADLAGTPPSEVKQERWQQLLRDIRAAGHPDHAVLSVCAGEMRSLIRS